MSDPTIEGAPVIDASDPSAFVGPSALPAVTVPTFRPSCWSRGISPELVVEGYRQGAFPWPDPFSLSQNLYPWGRLFPCTVLRASHLHLSHSLKKRVRDALAGHYCGHPLSIILDSDFDEVLDTLAEHHREKGGTWISDDMIRVWKTLHRAGHAHSVGVWVDGELAGGLYFTSVGRMLYGESMFSRLTDVSKLALAALLSFCRLTHQPVIDCQMATRHIGLLGGEHVSGDVFMTINRQLTELEPFSWHQAKNLSLIPFLRAANPELRPRQPRPEQAKTSLVPEHRLAFAGNLMVEVAAVRSPCNYYDTRISTMEVIPVSPSDPQVSLLYNRLIDSGFRRDSGYLYRLGCENCRRCIPTRIDVGTFRPDDTMRRTLRRNSDLIMTELPLGELTDEQYALYKRYQKVRHKDGTMGRMSRTDVGKVLFSTCVDTRILEFRRPPEDENPNRLMMVCIIDRLDGAISAVYTFYDPDEPKLSLGTFGILREIEYARENGLRYVYLGYWLPGYPGMDYKTRFQPLSIQWDEEWIPQTSFSADPRILDQA